MVVGSSHNLELNRTRRVRRGSLRSAALCRRAG